jgi:hypothetical protein
MLYDVRVLAGSHFELERDEPLVEGETLGQGSMIYKVLRLLPAEGAFDAVAVVEWLAGPAEVGRDPEPPAA